MATIGALTMLPASILSKNYKNKPLHFVGIGYSGSHLIKIICQKGFNAKYTIINDKKLSGMTSKIDFIEYIPPLRNVFNTTEHGKIRISDMSQKIAVPAKVKNLAAQDCRFVLIAGFGGYTGTYMTEQLTYLLNKNGKSFFTVCSSPFDFEDKNRKKIAREIKRKLQSVSELACIECNSIRNEYGNIPVKEAFERVDGEILQAVLKKI